MIYLRGTINNASYHEAVGKKKAFNYIQVAEEAKNGSIFIHKCKVYTDTKLKIGDEIDVQVKVSPWLDKNGKPQTSLNGFLNS